MRFSSSLQYADKAFLHLDNMKLFMGDKKASGELEATKHLRVARRHHVSKKTGATQDVVFGATHLPERQPISDSESHRRRMPEMRPANLNLWSENVNMLLFQSIAPNTQDRRIPTSKIQLIP